MWLAPSSDSDTTNAPLTDNNSDVLFQLVTLSSDTFVVPSTFAQRISQSCSTNTVFTGKVTCSVPFTSADGGAFLAVGCAEGFWIGFLHEPQSLRRVLPLKMVTQCATLEAFRIFLVLTEKALFAYDVDALVAYYLQPTEPSSHVPLKLSGEDDVQFFSLGSLEGRTLVAYMMKKGILRHLFASVPQVGRSHAGI